MNNEIFLTVADAAEICSITATFNSIRMAIKKKRLKASKDYLRSREKSMFEGELRFDNSKGFYSVVQVAKMLGFKKQKVYYALLEKYLKFIRKGGSLVIHIDDIKSYQQEYLSKKKKREFEAAPAPWIVFFPFIAFYIFFIHRILS